jgi:hypothetical protein
VQATGSAQRLLGSLHQDFVVCDYSPAWKNPPPIRIYVVPHFCLIVPFAISAFRVTLSTAGKLVVIQLNAQAWFLQDPYAAVDNRNSPAGHDLVLR